MTIDEIKKWMLESSGFPVTQANAEYLERFQAIAFQAGASSRDAEIAKLKEDLHFQACLTKYLMPYQERAVLAEKERDQLRKDVERLNKLVIEAKQAFDGVNVDSRWFDRGMAILDEALAATDITSIPTDI